MFYAFRTDGSRICPAGSNETVYPCTQSGECVFNSTTRTTECKCPAGLHGDRCRHGTLSDAY